MKWLEVKVFFEHDKPELAVDLISQHLYALNISGVVVEDPSLQPVEGWGRNSVSPPQRHAVIAYFPEYFLSPKRWQKLQRELAHLAQVNGIRTRTVISRLDEKNWAEYWKSHFHAEKVGKRLVVKPSWQEYTARLEEIVLVIDPGMAFGTGIHPTTRLCLNLIEAHMLPGDSLLDIGTGTGVLMIAAAKLGARKVCGIDIDQAAVAIAERNLKLNAVNPVQFTLICGNLIEAIHRRFDMVVVNILTEAIIVLLNDINRVLNKKGVFLGSGIIKKNQNSVIDKLKGLDFEIMNIYSEEEWVAIAAKPT
jgi:ribosomal protein L11 methyltransferase